MVSAYRVYDVTLPTIVPYTSVEGGKLTTCIAVANKTPDFAMKIIADPLKCGHERAVFEIVKPPFIFFYCFQ